MSSGTLDVLNVRAGDLKFSWDSESDVADARRVVRDLLRQGYLLVVETEEGTHVRVEDFDPDTDEYIVAAVPVVEAGVIDTEPVRPGDVEELMVPEVEIRKKGGPWKEVFVDGELLNETGLSAGDAKRVREKILAGAAPDAALRAVREGRRRVKAGRARATAVAPTAGG